MDIKKFNMLNNGIRTSVCSTHGIMLDDMNICSSCTETGTDDFYLPPNMSYPNFNSMPQSQRSEKISSRSDNAYGKMNGFLEDSVENQTTPRNEGTMIRMNEVRNKNQRNERIFLTRDVPLELVSSLLQNALQYIKFCDCGYMLPIEHFQFWYDIIYSDNIPAYERMMDEITNPDDKVALLNGVFAYKIPPKLRKSYYKPGHISACGFQRPLTLAAVLCADGLLPRMIKDGADVMIRDVHSFNVIHALIAGASTEAEKEKNYVYMYKMFMCSVDKENKRELLFAETDDNFRALELASKCGVFMMMKAILDTPNGHMSIVGTAGLQSYRRYDLSSYESYRSYTRVTRNPLRMLTFLQNKHMDSFLESGIIGHPAIKEWMDLKLWRAAPWILLWMLIRVIWLFTIGLSDPATELNLCQLVNSTICLVHGVRSKEQTWLTQITTHSYIVSAAFIGLDIIEFIALALDRERQKAVAGLPRTISGYATLTYFHRFIQFILCLVHVISRILIGVLEKDNVENQYKYNMMILAAIMPLIICSSFFILERISFLANFAIALQQMVIAMVLFLTFVTAISIGYAMFFMKAMPSAGFSNLKETSYNIFLVLGAMTDFGTNPPDYVILAHIIYFFIVVILLINYLIAMMSNIAIVSPEIQHARRVLRQLQVVFEVEYRGFGLLLCLRNSISKSPDRYNLHTIIPQPVYFRQDKTADFINL